MEEALENHSINSSAISVSHSPSAPSKAGEGWLEAELKRVDKSLEELAVKLAFKGRSKTFFPSLGNSNQIALSV